MAPRTISEVASRAARAGTMNAARLVRAGGSTSGTADLRVEIGIRFSFLLMNPADITVRKFLVRLFDNGNLRPARGLLSRARLTLSPENTVTAIPHAGAAARCKDLWPRGSGFSGYSRMIGVARRPDRDPGHKP
jgi:hypothetical protein